MKVLIKGAGDLATGIALKLHRCGFQVAMTEQAMPTTVRRTVAFSKAVYENRVQVENTYAVLCNHREELYAALAQNEIGIMIDEACSMREWFKPHVLVDAIIAKRNLGTLMTDAKTVIGVGPGFVAGEDCHCVIETSRGHDLGRCIWSGGAIPNTGIPGAIGGYTTERIIRAAGDGIFTGKVSIGDTVKCGDTVGLAGTVPIQAKIDGIVRGLLQDGVRVTSGMKAGDIDPRCVRENCFTVSDKANAIGGGVLEAIMSIEKQKGNRIVWES